MNNKGLKLLFKGYNLVKRITFSPGGGYLPNHLSSSYKVHDYLKSNYIYIYMYVCMYVCMYV